MVNSYLLASRSGTWKETTDSHLEWRKALVSQLFSTYSPEFNARSLCRPGIFIDCRNDSVPSVRHVQGKRDGRAVCKVCISVYRAKKKEALRADAGEALELLQREPKSRTTWGCITCNVAICRSALCWDMFHYSKIGVY
jgi:hypothetical protein